MANQKSLSPKSLEALQILKEGTFTMNELVERGLDNLNSANLTALVNRGLISSEQVVVEVPTVVKRKVNAYTLTDKGKAFKGE
jgi:predicted transcriptional regulator